MKLEWIVSAEDHQCRIDDFAYKHRISKKALKSIKFEGDILVNGIHQTVRYLLKVNDVVTFLFPKEKNHIIPEKIKFSIVYEDEYMMLIDKPKDIPCIPTRAHPSHTLANAISYYYQEIGLQSTIHFVNRLDKETRGLMIVAKYRFIHDVMGHCHIHRIYRAHVQGKVTQGTIRLPIYKDGYHMKRIVDERGKTSCTHYRLLDEDGLVEFRLETGRTHQIRLHMSAIGHPLVGDPLYGDGVGEFDLESYKMAFLHPITKQYIYIEKKTCKMSF